MVISGSYGKLYRHFEAEYRENLTTSRVLPGLRFVIDDPRNKRLSDSHPIYVSVAGVQTQRFVAHHPMGCVELCEEAEGPVVVNGCVYPQAEAGGSEYWKLTTWSPPQKNKYNLMNSEWEVDFYGVIDDGPIDNVFVDLRIDRNTYSGRGRVIRRHKDMAVISGVGMLAYAKG